MLYNAIQCYRMLFWRMAIFFQKSLGTTWTIRFVVHMWSNRCRRSANQTEHNGRQPGPASAFLWLEMMVCVQFEQQCTAHYHGTHWHPHPKMKMLANCYDLNKQNLNKDDSSATDNQAKFLTVLWWEVVWMFLYVALGSTNHHNWGIIQYTVTSYWTRINTSTYIRTNI